MLPTPRQRRVSDSEEYHVAGTRSEYADILAKRVVFSRAHTLLCSSMLVAGVVEVSWIVLPISSGSGQLPDHPMFILVEAYVTLGLVLEIALRIILQRREFCQRWSNVFDIVVASVSVVSAALYATGLETPAEMLLGTIVVVCRIVFRLTRLVALSRGFRAQRAASATKLDIDLEASSDFSPVASPHDELIAPALYYLDGADADYSAPSSAQRRAGFA